MSFTDLTNEGCNDARKHNAVHQQLQDGIDAIDPDVIWDIDGGYANSVYGGVDVSVLDGGASNSWS